MRLTTAKKMLLLRRRAVPTRAERILSLSPVGYWRLDDGSGVVAADSSGNGQDGSISGASWDEQMGPDSTPALYFDGINDFVVMPDTVLHRPVSSVSVFFLARAAGATGSAFSCDNGSWDGGYLQIGFPAFCIRGYTDGMQVAPDYTEDIWQSWALVYDGTTMRVYRDGVHVGSNNSSSGAMSYGGSSLLRLGKLVGHSYFAGAMQHFALFNYALSAPQVAYLSA